jgi:hypothetical protein
VQSRSEGVGGVGSCNEQSGSQPTNPCSSGQTGQRPVQLRTPSAESGERTAGEADPADGHTSETAMSPSWACCVLSLFYGLMVTLASWVSCSWDRVALKASAMHSGLGPCAHVNFVQEICFPAFTLSINQLFIFYQTFQWAQQECREFTPLTSVNLLVLYWRRIRWVCFSFVWTAPWSLVPQSTISRGLTPSSTCSATCESN